MKYVEVPCNLCGSGRYSVIARGPDFEYSTVPDEFTVVKCNECGMVYLNPRPRPCELETIYPKSYVPYRFDEHLSRFVNSLRIRFDPAEILFKCPVCFTAKWGVNWFSSLFREK